MVNNSTNEKLQERITELEIEIARGKTREEAIHIASKNINSDLSLEKALNNIVLQITNTLQISGCTISLWNRDRNSLETMVDYSRIHPEEVDKTGTVYQLQDFPKTRYVLETGHTTIIQHDDLSEEKSELALMSNWKIYTLVMSPLIVKSKVIGLLELNAQLKPRTYSIDEVNLIESLASHAAIAIRNSHLYEKAQHEISERKNAEEELTKLVNELEKALSEIRTLSGLLPICSHCKKNRDDKGYWNSVEGYIQERTEAKFSHSICRSCAKEHYPDLEIYKSK